MALQSNLSAKEACVIWEPLVQAARTHRLRLGSPAVNYCQGAGNRTKGCFQDAISWFDEFFEQPSCGLDSVDFLTTHKYGCNGSDTLEYMEELHRRYNKTVMLTEFNCGAGAGAEAHLKLMNEALPLFESSPAVEGFAWFAARTNQASTSIQASATLLSDGDKNTTILTPLGVRYLDFEDKLR